MEVEEATKPADAEQAEVPSSDHLPDTVDRSTKGSQLEDQTKSTEAALDGECSKRPKSLVKQEHEDRPSKRVREGQKWNDRPRKQYGNQDGRPRKRHNNKSDLVSQQESSDPVAIRKQVEFYFSDSNLLTDKFLFTQVEGHENLPVPIGVIHSFKRMRHFQPLSAIVDALKESAVLNIVEGDTAIQRKIPLPEGLVGKPMVEIQKVHEDKSMARSVYAKGFGEEQPSAQFDIEAFFAEHGSTNSVRLRRSYDGTFKGSVFVEFDSEETQKAFLALDPKPKWQGNELQIKSKKQYCDDKVDDIAAGLVRPNDDSHFQARGNKGGRRDRNERDDKDDRDWRIRRDEDRKSGFKDRNRGKHRGFGGSGRARDGQGRDGRRRSQNRNEERREKDERGVPEVITSSPANDEKTEKQVEVPTKVIDEFKDDIQISQNKDVKSADVTVAPPEALADATGKAGSKKRAREVDDGIAEQREPKKVDLKGEES